MDEFRSWRSYWQFAYSVREKFRFVHDEETRTFLEVVAKTSAAREIRLEEGSILWRSQVGSEWTIEDRRDEGEIDIELPFRPERMKPLRGRAAEGRANSRGIAFLYLSDDPETAMSEVRPWVGVTISLGRFRTVRDLRLVDCSREHRNLVFFSEPSPDRRREAVWNDIDRAFARPVTPDEHSTDYIPTQILAELFRQCGFDGITHHSSVGGGRNFILFDLEAANLTGCRLYITKSIEFTFSESGNPYSVSHEQDGK